MKTNIRRMREIIANAPILSLVVLAIATSSVSHAQTRVGVARASERIINGDPVLQGQGPWAASLRYEIMAGDLESVLHFCGGSFVSPMLDPAGEKVLDWISDDPAPRWLVTAAHCVVNDDGTLLDVARLSVLGGARNRTNEDGRGEVQLVSAILPHPDFNPETLEHDIALLQLSPSTNLTLEKVRRASIRFPEPRDTIWLNEPYLSVYVQGWGLTETGSDSIQLKEVQLPLVDHAFCKGIFAKHGETIGDGMLCAGFVDGNFDSCQGDSGGPMVYRNEGPIATPRSDSPVLIGIVSWGIGCGRNDLFGIYTAASVYRTWAERTVVGFLSSN